MKFITKERASVPVIAAAALVVGVVGGAGLSVFAAAPPAGATSAATTTPRAPFGGARIHGEGVVGTVTAVSGSTLTVKAKNGGTYTINTSGATVTKVGNGTSTTMPASSVAVGDTVMVRGSIVTATMTAKTVRDGALPTPVHPAVVGKVTAVNGTTLTVDGRAPHGATITYTVNASGATVTKGPNTTGSVSDIKTGDFVAIEGSINGSTVTATAIHDGFGPHGFGWHGQHGPHADTDADGK